MLFEGMIIRSVLDTDLEHGCLSPHAHRGVVKRKSYRDLPEVVAKSQFR